MQKRIYEDNPWHEYSTITEKELPPNGVRVQAETLNGFIFFGRYQTSLYGIVSDLYGHRIVSITQIVRWREAPAPGDKFRILDKQTED